ncbi:peroxidase 63-like [Impatiens glandulifera]|uniref:peroxidase 63-like n=1 Tax=Impatiens glandulifera TaxID=253017 RepID=UPI001FB120A2|nr:peroxidase 63-like [Impatiens glandulifera]
MAFFPLILVIISLSSLIFINPVQSQLKPNYYHKSCPRFDQIIQETITNKQIISPSTAAGTLRLFFHDCFVQGCDASVLITSTPFNKAERDADINLSLPGDAFDVIVRAKIALELACPGIVSCADILAVSTRDLVRMVGGPYYNLKLGRKDSFTSKSINVDGKLPKPTMSINQLLDIFFSNGFSIQEMVALSGAHTIGFSHCKEFSSGLYNYGGKKEQFDPTYNPRFAEALRKACADSQKNPTLSVFNDIMTPNNFDNSYFQNLPKGWGLLSSDRAFFSDQRTKPFVQLFSANQTAFFEAFGLAMVKLSENGVKIGRQGEIRRRCDAFN